MIVLTKHIAAVVVVCADTNEAERSLHSKVLLDMEEFDKYKDMTVSMRIDRVSITKYAMCSCASSGLI